MVPSNFVRICKLSSRRGRTLRIFPLTGGSTRTSYVNRLVMKISICTSLMCGLCGALTAASTPDAARVFATAPLRFEPAANGSSNRFVARGARFRFSFSGNEALFQTGERDIRLDVEVPGRNGHVDGISQH